MYQLNKFCNIIFDLRKERGWTQTMLAEKLNIAPQSISKWECGIGYPNVTLFPVIAELFHVPIGVLFGEGSEEGKVAMDLGSERNFVFEPLEDIEIMVGNPCDIEVKDGVSDHASLHVEGDLKFVEYISAEIIDGKLYVNIKNPTGSLFIRVLWIQIAVLRIILILYYPRARPSIIRISGPAEKKMHRDKWSEISGLVGC